MHPNTIPGDPSNPAAILSSAEVAISKLLEPVQQSIADRATGDDDDVFLTAGTGLMRARMVVREALFAVQRQRAEQRWRQRAG